MMLIRHAPKTRRERFVLWLIRRLIPSTPLIVNAVLGPAYDSVSSRDGRTILVDRVVFDLSEFTRELARHAGASPGKPEKAYDPRDDALTGYLLGCACERERGIRAGHIAPEPQRAHEAAWAAEGPRPTRELDTLATWRPPE